MEKEDARRTPVSLHERRKQVVRLHRKGYGPMKIAELTGLSWGAVNTALKLYESGGSAALKPKTRGRKSGMCRTLADEQELRIQKLICEKRPEQLKMDFALWTRGAVKELIQRELGLVLSIRAVGDYLGRWGFTPQKPIKRAYEQQPKAVRKWLDEEYPEIERRALTEGAEIHWGDETCVMNTDVRGRSYSPRGQTPETRAVWGRREKFSMISTVTNRGKCRWMIIDGAFNSDRLIEFMGLLIKDAGRKIFLVLDNLRVHHSKLVKEWVAKHEDEIELFFLPSYSPELNPDERLNADLKHKITTAAPARTRKKLLDVTTGHMKLLEHSPERVASYFGDPHISYAAYHNI
ncbi:MAG: IS630 family transposase [Verrucomicrobia bacterium]|nr:IS630 family transposase [Verrucomicrobiota bacterium]